MHLAGLGRTNMCKELAESFPAFEFLVSISKAVSNLDFFCGVRQNPGPS